MAKKIVPSEYTEIVKIDDEMNELFDIEAKRRQQKKSLSYIPSFFTTASLPFRNVNKPTFVRKGSNGITLTLMAKENVPFGKYGRLLLSVLTTHAVISTEKGVPVYIQYEKLSDLLNELQLPKSRGPEIREQLDCFCNAQFSFEQKISESKSNYLFKEMYEDGNLPKRDIIVTTKTTGNIRFTEGIQYQEIDDGTADKKCVSFKIILSPEFADFCQAHAVPIDYSVYKEISSAAGKDIYAWLVYRNNAITEPVFVPRQKLVEQFMPTDENSNRNQENVNYYRIIDQLKEIKEKYYPEVKFSIDENGAGITLFKSPTPVIANDTRYALITSDI